MDRLIRKLSTSPKARQKLVIGSAKIFGVPLRYLTSSTEGQRVPRLVSTICRCLVQNGLQLQGIFRINGGVRLIESLKRQFQSSNADLNLDRMTSSTELYALAGVLKLFLREVPGGVVPKDITAMFIQNGLQLQGIFRINGGVRLIESLKRQFQSSNADLNLDRMTSSTELYALGRMVQLLIRSTPRSSSAPVLGELSDSQSVDLTRLEELVLQLPEENAHLLHYVCHFLSTVADHESVNKMSAEGLGILFGPCVFHCNLQVQVS
ncbi:hypothetical protein AHF37_08721 [Paragonimus kellicotti]|nr:hypothetical protein AHF37_08721 [Paragonimus kellicotti]